MPAKPSDRKSTRLNSSHLGISYAVFCLKKIQDHSAGNVDDPVSFSRARWFWEWARASDMRMPCGLNITGRGSNAVTILHSFFGGAAGANPVPLLPLATPGRY